MSSTSFSDALRPLASRMPKVTREYEVLRVAASLDSKEHDVLAAARHEILRWTERRSGGQLPPEAWKFKSFQYLSGGRNCAGLRLKNRQSDIWALRADDPDKNIAGRTWTHEIVIGSLSGQKPQFSVRQLVSTSEEELVFEPHSPGFILQIADKCGISHGPFRLDTRPRVIASEDDAQELIDIILDARRSAPVFVLTVPEGADDPSLPLVDAAVLARATTGIAHVAILPAKFTWALTDRFGKQRSVFGGAVRAYMPDFDENANPYGHRLVLADSISHTDGRAQCIRWMRSLAASESVKRNKLGKEALAFSTIRKARLLARQKSLEGSGAGDAEKLEAANEQIKALEEDLRKAEEWEQHLSDEHKRAEERAEAAEEQQRAATYRIQQLFELLKAKGEPPDNEFELPVAWAEFASWCDVNLAGRLVLAPAARRGTKSPVFKDVAQAARCLLWLAGECRDRRMGSGEGSLRDISVEDGIWNSPCGGDEFDLYWQGQRYTADWHVKNGGNTRDPVHCLRIYYFWEPNSQQIVVADMPAHRRTGMT